CGVAMLVPLLSRSPPPAFADKILTPGPATCAPALEKGATEKGLLGSLVCPTAATATTASAAAGGAAVMQYPGRLLSLPAAATITTPAPSRFGRARRSRKLERRSKRRKVSR